MVGFTQRNGAAKFKLPLKVIFAIMHVLYGTIFLFGVFYRDFYSCQASKYPVAFIV